MSPVRLVPDELIEHVAIRCDACVRKWPRLCEREGDQSRKNKFFVEGPFSAPTSQAHFLQLTYNLEKGLSRMTAIGDAS